MGEKKPKYNSNFLILNTSNKITSSKTSNNNLYNELFIDKLNTFLDRNKYLFSTWMIKNKNNRGIDYNTVHKEHMMDNYFVPLAYLIYSYAYITFQKNNKLKELILNNEYKFHIYNNYVFNYNNPIVKKVNVFIYRFYEQNMGTKNSKSQYFINELTDDSYIEKLIAILNRFIKLFDNEDQNILYEVYAKIEKLKNDIDKVDSSITNTIKLFNHLKNITDLTQFSSFYDKYKNINAQIIDIYDIIHKLNIKNVYYLNDIFDINIMNISKASFNNFYTKIENYVGYSKFIKENITQTKDFLKNLVLKIKEFKYIMYDLYVSIENKKNNKKSENIKIEINKKITYFINEIKQSIINTIENYKIVTTITGTIEPNGTLNINPQNNKVFGNVGQYITIDGINYKIGTKNGANYILDPKPNFSSIEILNSNKNISVQIGKNDNFLSYTTLKNVFNTLISSVEVYLKCNINYINNIRNNITNTNYKNINYDIENFKKNIIKYYKLLNKNNKNESYYTKTQKRYNDYMENQIKEINSYKLDFKNNGRSNSRPSQFSEDGKRKIKEYEATIVTYSNILAQLNGDLREQYLNTIYEQYKSKIDRSNRLRYESTNPPESNEDRKIKKKNILKGYIQDFLSQVNQQLLALKTERNTKQTNYNSYILKKTINQKCDAIITNTLKELEQIKTIQINDTKTNILNNSSIETSIMNYMDFIQNMLKIFEDKINQMNFQGQKYKINANLENDGIITLYHNMTDKDISYIFEDKTKYFIKDNPKSFLKIIDEIIEKNTNNKLFTDNIKLFFTKYKEYCNDVIKKIKNIMDKISTNELVFIDKNGNNSSNKKYFDELMLQLFSKRNLKLGKIIQNISYHQSKELQGKYIAVFPYTDILFRYLIYLMNISDTLSINTSNNFYIK